MSLLKTVIMLVITTALLAACSGDSEKEAQTGKIDAMTKEMGQEAVRMIKAPKNKALEVAEQAEKRAKETDERKDQ